MSWTSDRLGLLRSWSVAVNAAATGGSEDLERLAVSEHATAVRRVLINSPRTRAFQQGYLVGASDSCGAELAASVGTAFEPYEALESAIGAARRDELPGPDAVRATLASVDDRHDIEPDVAAFTLGRLLGLLWRPANQASTNGSMFPVLDALVSGIRAIDPQPAELDAERVLVMTGSGKRRRQMPSITTAAAVVAAVLLERESDHTLIVKPVSGGTSYRRGSADALRDLGIQARPRPDGPGRLRFVSCERSLPRFARIYHGLSHGPTIIGMCAPAVLAAGVRPQWILYGLTDGSVQSCAATLARSHTSADVLVIAGRRQTGAPLVDELSPVGPSDWARARHDYTASGRWPAFDGISGLPNEMTTLQGLFGHRASAVWTWLVARQAALAVALVQTLERDLPGPPDPRQAFEVLRSEDLRKFVRALVAAGQS